MAKKLTSKAFSTVAPAIYRLGAAIRNPSLRSIYEQLKESESWGREALELLQWQRLDRAIRRAYHHSDHYRRLLDEIGYDSKNPLLTKDFLLSIPITTKQDLISFNEENHAKGISGRTFACETSGTSGQVLTFRRDEYWDSFNRASIARGYSWYGVKPHEFSIYFWGYNTSLYKKAFVRGFDALVNRYRVFDYSEENLEKVESLLQDVSYIEGYSSMIYELAKRLAQKGRSIRGIKMVKATSEKIYPHYEEVVREVFGVPLTSEYGSAETGIIAFSCPRGRMHVNLEGVYSEVEQDGSIVVTNLMGSSFPVLRYRLGDVVRFASDEFYCDCGLQHPVLEEVTGRLGSKIVGNDRDFPSLTLYYVFKNLYFDHGLSLTYQGQQSVPGKLLLLVEENPPEADKALLIAEAKKYFGDSVEISFEFGQNLRAQPGKMRDFVGMDVP